MPTVRTVIDSPSPTGRITVNAVRGSPSTCRPAKDTRFSFWPVTSRFVIGCLSPGTPTEIASAKKADRLAWTAYEHGLRNVFTAAAPDFKPVRLTNFLKDDGVDLGAAT